MYSTVILCSDMPCEICAAALYHCLDENSVIISMKVADTRSIDLIKLRITNACSEPKKIILLGTYWTDYCLARLVTDFKSNIIQYCFGEITEYKGSRIEFVSGKDGLGPTRFLFKQAKIKV